MLIMSCEEENGPGSLPLCRGRSLMIAEASYWQEPEPTLIVMPRETEPEPLPAVISPTCLAAAGEVMTLKAGLTVCPAGMKTDAGTLAPVTLLESCTVTPPGAAGPVR